MWVGRLTTTWDVTYSRQERPPRSSFSSSFRGMTNENLCFPEEKTLPSRVKATVWHTPHSTYAAEGEREKDRKKERKKERQKERKTERKKEKKTERKKDRKKGDMRHSYVGCKQQQQQQAPPVHSFTIWWQTHTHTINQSKVLCSAPSPPPLHKWRNQSIPEWMFRLLLEGTQQEKDSRPVPIVGKKERNRQHQEARALSLSSLSHPSLSHPSLSLYFLRCFSHGLDAWCCTDGTI